MGRETIAREAAQDALGYRPLYRRVRDVLVKRISEGLWHAGAVIPSEPELAADLGVSQGTVRKALDAMAAERLVVRRRAGAPTSPATTTRASCSSSSSWCPTTARRGSPDSRFLEVGSGRAGRDRGPHGSASQAAPG